MKTNIIGSQPIDSDLADRIPLGTVTMSRDAEGNERPAPAAQQRNNPHIASMAKRAGLTAADLQKHGPSEVRYLPNLRDLIEATERRGK